MFCIGLVGCKHIHPSASGYFLLLLLVAVILLGLRILLHLTVKCLDRCRHGLTPNNEEEIEIQARGIHTLQQFHQLQEWRRSAPMAARSTFPPEEWQNKLVIAAGCDHISFIARPCPLQTTTSTSN